MLPIHIGLVPDGGFVDEAELLRVAATLQMQLTRDFEPVWQTPAVLSAFTSLDQLPPACLPLVILPAGRLGPGGHAFHTTKKGTPMGLVEYKPGGSWSLAASHELLEMVCDPQGKRKVMGDSIADLELDKVADGNAAYLPQGQVAYLVEVCDPCQDQPYALNGFQVSDFVLPRFYSRGGTECECYSFAGNVAGPLQLCDGGYVTWYTSFDEAPVWQAIKDSSGELTIGPMTIPANGPSRADVDFNDDVFDSTDAPAAPDEPTVPSQADARHAAELYGAQLRDDLHRVLNDAYGPSVDVNKLLDLINELATSRGYWNELQDETRRSADLKQRLGIQVCYPSGLPSQKQLAAVHAKAQQIRGRATGGKVSARAATMMMLGQT
jgi:hypothetical protein